MKTEMYYMIGYIVMGMINLIFAILTKYVPIHMIGRNTWYKIKKEYEIEYLRFEVASYIVYACYFFVIALTIYLNVFTRYVFIISIIVAVGISWYFNEKTKNFLRK